MPTVKADDHKRIRIPEAKPGQVFSYEVAEDGTIVLHQVKKAGPAESKPARVKFVQEDGYTVGVSDKPVSQETIRELLSEFP